VEHLPRLVRAVLPTRDGERQARRSVRVV
jgi:hypothetical protein